MEDSSHAVRGSRLPWVIAVVAVVLLLAGSVWSALSLLAPAADPLADSPSTYVEVSDGEVGSSLTLNSVASWTSTPAGVNQAQGIVTSTPAIAGGEVDQGDVLYTVDLRPVVVAEGEVPAFRSIGGDEVVRGADVAQLQGMLAALGFYGGTLDGVAGQGTSRAIMAWQKASGADVTGVVSPGDIIFVPQLPARVTLNPEIISRGALLSGGEKAVNVISLSPDFSVPATDGQAQVMVSGVRVEISAPNGETWPAVVKDQVRDEENNTVTVRLEAPDGGPICLASCGELSVTENTTLVSKIITVEPVEGLVIPSAALMSDAQGETLVVDDEGTNIPVTVLTSAQGMSVVEGVSEGTKVQINPGGAVK